MIKAVIFDFGGVVHSLGNKKLSVILAKKTGRKPNEIKELIISGLIAMSIRKITEDEFWERLGGKIEGVWKEQLKNNRLNAQIIELVKSLKVRGIKTVVLSNTIPAHTNIIKPMGWYDTFDRVFLSWEIGLRKPDIKAYKYVLDDLKLKGEECIYVDDLEVNLIPAKELGMKTILAVNPKQVVEEVEKSI